MSADFGLTVSTMATPILVNNVKKLNVLPPICLLTFKLQYQLILMDVMVHSIGNKTEKKNYCWDDSAFFNET